MPAKLDLRTGLVAGTLALSTACTATPRDLPACVVAADVPPSREPVVVVAAGDLVDCAGGAQEQTAKLAESIHPDAVIALGDLVYPNATLDEFLDCYAPTWGRLRSLTHAVVGNHEYHTQHAGPYWAYFCGASGPPFRGYYSFSLGTWHAVVLNSNCGQDPDVPGYVPDDFGGCNEGSPQAVWLEQDLTAHRGKCTIIAWHHPHATSGKDDDGGRMRALWSIAQNNGADVVINGHAHLYDRFGKLDADQRPSESGMRSFVVGAGGHELTMSVRSPAGLEASNDTHHGVLRLELSRQSFSWQFVSSDDGAVLDSGEAPCAP
jgi:3',5'-cyclic AMP phosphodiesterase CpdA